MFDMMSSIMLAQESANNRDEVGRSEYPGGMVDTYSVLDAPSPFETAVEDKRYKDGWMIVEYYGTREEAASGHAKWVAKMSADSPQEYVDDIAADGWNEHFGNNGRCFLRKSGEA